MSSFGERIRAGRLRAGLSPSEFAGRCWVTRVRLDELERGGQPTPFEATVIPLVLRVDAAPKDMDEEDRLRLHRALLDCARRLEGGVE